MTNRILVVEDDNGLSQYMRELLLENKFFVQTASDGALALKTLKNARPDLVILDLMLPNVSGETVCLEIRKDYPDLPVIILTAKDTTSNIVSGLALGADDYMTKPFVGDELIARIRARLRNNAPTDKKLQVVDLTLDNKTFEVIRNSKKISLTPQEFKLLSYLMNNKNHVLTRDMILSHIWLYSSEVETRVVDVYMGYLRKKIDNGFKKKLIHSVRGFGYMIKE